MIGSRELNVVLERTTQTIVGKTLAKFDKNDKKSRNWNMISNFTQWSPFFFSWSRMFLTIVNDFGMTDSFLLFFKLFWHDAEEEKRDRERMPEVKRENRENEKWECQSFYRMNHWQWLVRSYKGSHPSGANRHDQKWQFYKCGCSHMISV